MDATTARSGGPFTPVPPVQKLGKFKASKMVVRESWALLKQDKEILWFPILSAIVSLFVLVLVGLAYFAFVLGGDASILVTMLDGNESAFTAQMENIGAGAKFASYVILFLYYLLSFLVINFFQACIFIVAHARFSAQDLDFMDGIRGAGSRFDKIAAWSLLMATVGVILNILENRLHILGKLVVWLLGAAWTILTFFSLPALIIGGMSVRGSFRESATIIRKTWGEVIIVTVGVGLVFTILAAAGTIIAIVLMVLMANVIAAIIVAILLVMYLIALAIVASALGTIFKLALYEYARTGIVPVGFSPELVKIAIQAKT